MGRTPSFPSTVGKQSLLALLLFLFLAGLVAAAPASRTWLGVLVRSIDYDELAEYDLDYGVRIQKVFPNSPAAQAGIKRGDILIRFNGNAVYSPARLAWLVRQYRPGDQVQLEIYRDGRTEQVKLTLGKRKAAGRGGNRQAYLGIKLQTLSPALRKYFGAPEDRGILIADVAKNSPADEAGLYPGDVILKMDRKIIRSIRDVYRVLAFFEPGDAIVIEYIRDRRKQQTRVTLGERAAPGIFDGWPDDFPVHFQIPFLDEDVVIFPERLQKDLWELRQFLQEIKPEWKQKWMELQSRWRWVFI